MDGDCFSVAAAIHSKHQIIGNTFNCDTNISRMVLWDHGSVIDLNAAIPANSKFQLIEPDNINDRGEIVGRGLPAGCDDLDACGHVFLLIPCDRASTQQCADNAGSTAGTAGIQGSSHHHTVNELLRSGVLGYPSGIGFQGTS